MGHKISKEQIDPGVKDHIMSFVGDVADLETEVNTDIISAVNSLMVDRVDNAENMGKLANAIGEPVTANHSVDEVVQGLGEMLSTFKTNMMNSGVMVESNDKFKQLIDKIKGLTEGEGNKGIKFAMGEGNWTVSASNWGVSNEITIETNIGFIPSYIICKLSRVSVYFSNGSSSQGLNINNVFLSNLSPIDATIFDKYMSYGIPNSDIFIKNITENSFVLAETCTNVSGATSRMSGTLTEWYAIGVGEEDTTLRDSLASILQEEGVSVTEEDDMASLISKVDELVKPAGTATASNVLSGQTFINSTGQLVTGTMANQGSKTVTPSASNQTLDAGYYNGITINGDADLVAANIVSGKNIFGVNGSATITSLGGSQVYKTSISATTVSNGGTLNYNCPFTPSIILLNLSIMRVASGGAASEAQNVWVSNLYTTTLATEYSSRFTNTVTVSNVTSTSCKFTYNSGSWSSAPTVNYIICIK